MYTLRDEIAINAPIERCFLLSTSIEVVARTLSMHTVADPKATRREGMIVANDRLLWRGWKFGLPQLHESMITGYAEPTFFQDTMGRGRFKSFQHDHHFAPTGPGTCLLQDELRFTLPFGFAGDLVSRVIMIPYIRTLLRERFGLIKHIAETDEWRGYLEPA